MHLRQNSDMNHIRQNGWRLSRRQTLMLFKATGAAVFVGCVPRRSDSEPIDAIASSTSSTTAPSVADAATLPTCVVRPEQTEGPYFVDERLERSDIRSDPTDGSVTAGLPLQLTFRISQVSSAACVPLAGAMVDVWHCDAAGHYSDVTDRSFSTEGQKFLRGYQVTDDQGMAQFITIYPGWYPGRTVHIHFKIRTDTASRQTYEFTSQLYFDDAVSDRVYAQPPYNSREQRTQTNADDGIFRRGGEQLLLTLTETDAGYAATFDIGLQV